MLFLDFMVFVESREREVIAGVVIHSDIGLISQLMTTTISIRDRCLFMFKHRNPTTPVNRFEFLNVKLHIVFSDQ